MILRKIVDSNMSGMKLKHILKSQFQLSERLIKKLKNNEKILLNGNIGYIKEPVSEGDLIEVIIKFDQDSSFYITPQDIPINILHEDSSLIVLNKNPGIVVHPAASHKEGTIANGLIKYFMEKGQSIKIHPVSRLDKDTSGIIIFAKNSYVQELLIKQSRNNIFKKEYLALTYGHISPEKGTINLPIKRISENAIKRHVSAEGKPAITHYEVIEYLNNASFVKFILETGRTHQIRVHCDAIGHPILGDSLYYSEQSNNYFSSYNNIIERQALHAYKVQFMHPETKSNFELIAPIPNDIIEAKKYLKVN